MDIVITPVVEMIWLVLVSVALLLALPVYPTPSFVTSFKILSFNLVTYFYALLLIF